MGSPGLGITGVRAIRRKKLGLKVADKQVSSNVGSVGSPGLPAHTHTPL